MTPQERNRVMHRAEYLLDLDGGDLDLDLDGILAGMAFGQIAVKDGRVAHECAEGVWLTWPDGERVAVNLRPACDPGAEALLIERCPHYADHGEEP